jgi:sulfur carrier protein ThiS
MWNERKYRSLFLDLTVERKRGRGSIMPAKVAFKDEEFEVKAGITAKQALAEIGVAWQTVLITRDGVLISGDEILKEGEIIKLVPAVSGG